MLFNNVNDRQRTRLAYMVKYYPYHELNSGGKDLIVWESHSILSKEQFVNNCNEELTKLAMRYHAPSKHLDHLSTAAKKTMSVPEYTIVWEYNNVPTKIEWDKLPPEQTIYCQFRRSPAIPELAIVLISLTNFGRSIKQHSATY
jgi:hypothetical protein